MVGVEKRFEQEAVVTL